MALRRASGEVWLRFYHRHRGGPTLGVWSLTSCWHRPCESSGYGTFDTQYVDSVSRGSVLDDQVSRVSVLDVRVLSDTRSLTSVRGRILGFRSSTSVRGRVLVLGVRARTDSRGLVLDDRVWLDPRIFQSSPLRWCRNQTGWVGGETLYRRSLSSWATTSFLAIGSVAT
jgi:hypothetical protein